MPEQDQIVCPYCDGVLSGRALSCRFCGRDLTPILPLLKRLDAVESRLSLVEKARDSGPLSLPSPDHARTVEPSEASILLGRRNFQALGAGFIVLLVAYWMIVIWLDLSLAILRLASVAIPFVVGFAYFGGRARLTRFDGLVAPLFAVAAVAAMNALLGWIDSTPMVPQGTAAWRETFFYALSIGASMLAGMLLRVSMFALAARGLTSLPRLREGVLAVNGKVPIDTLKAIELTILLVSTFVSTITGLLAGFLGVFR